MRCKVGDLAVLVRSVDNVNLGKVCVVLRPHGLPGFWTVQFPHAIGWSSWMTSSVAQVGGCPDEWLRPIRDNDGQDETLAWKETPTQIIKELTRHE